MKRTTRIIVSLITTGIAVLSMRADAPSAGAANKTIVYFLRHCEDVPELVGSDPSFSVTFNNCNADGSCCMEVLHPLGRVHATVLADWFEAKKITRTLTHVIASHKIRTRQTVEKIALAAGLGGDLDGNGTLDGTDVDQAPGDGVINVPATPAECDPGWTSSASVRQPQIDYLRTLPLGSRAVLCSHSPVLYLVMQAFGIDTSDPEKFPKDSRGRVRGFDNVWVVEFCPTGPGGSYQGRLLEHLLLDFELGVSLTHRDYGNGASQGAKSDNE